MLSDECPFLPMEVVYGYPDSILIDKKGNTGEKKKCVMCKRMLDSISLKPYDYHKNTEDMCYTCIAVCMMHKRNQRVQTKTNVKKHVDQMKDLYNVASDKKKSRSITPSKSRILPNKEF